MKTRSELYGHEATELLRILSMYPGLSGEQLCRFYPGREEVVKNLLSHFKRQGRIQQDEAGRYFPYATTSGTFDPGLIRAVWVLLDFIGRVEYHSPGSFPARLVFFAGGELYEVIHAPTGLETLVTQAVRQTPESGGRRIVLVDEPNQIPLLDFPAIAGFCTVDPAGTVSYYQKQPDKKEDN